MQAQPLQESHVSDRVDVPRWISMLESSQLSSRSKQPNARATAQGSPETDSCVLPQFWLSRAFRLHHATRNALRQVVRRALRVAWCNPGSAWA